VQVNCLGGGFTPVAAVEPLSHGKSVEPYESVMWAVLTLAFAIVVALVAAWVAGLHEEKIIDELEAEASRRRHRS
jgi:hypothetical protein